MKERECSVMVNEVKLALEMSRLVHNECKEVPHDIGLRLLDIVKKALDGSPCDYVYRTGDSTVSSHRDNVPCDSCGCHPLTMYISDEGTFCSKCMCQKINNP
jgi:predicted transcriptional regulator